MRRRFCALSIMTLVAVYLFAGGLAYHAMDDPHRSLANRYDASSRSVMMMVDALAAGQIMPEKTIRPDKRVILFNYYFQKSIAGPVLIGGIAFWIWLNAHRRPDRQLLLRKHARPDLGRLHRRRGQHPRE